jgi:hypothetical protein
MLRTKRIIIPPEKMRSRLFCIWKKFNVRRWMTTNQLLKFFYNCKKLIQWTPVIWKDEDWDYSYIDRLLQYKISRIRKVIEANMRHAGDEKIIKEMRQAEFLLERIYSDDYYYELTDRNRSRWVKCDCPEEPFEFLDLPDGGSRLVSHYCSSCEVNGRKMHLEMTKKLRADRIDTYQFIAKKMSKWWD